jgi:hypothetical protein
LTIFDVFSVSFNGDANKLRYISTDSHFSPWYFPSQVKKCRLLFKEMPNALSTSWDTLQYLRALIIRAA